MGARKKSRSSVTKKNMNGGADAGQAGTDDQYIDVLIRHDCLSCCLTLCKVTIDCLHVVAADWSNDDNCSAFAANLRHIRSTRVGAARWRRPGKEQRESQLTEARRGNSSATMMLTNVEASRAPAKGARVGTVSGKLASTIP